MRQLYYNGKFYKRFHEKVDIDQSLMKISILGLLLTTLIYSAYVTPLTVETALHSQLL